MSIASGPTRPHQPSHLIFRKKGDLYAVYDGCRLLRVLSRITTHLARAHGGKLAQQCARLLHRINQAGACANLAWTAKPGAVRQAIEQVFRDQYGVQVKHGLLSVRLMCGARPASPPTTINTVLYLLKLAFAALNTLKLRADHPLDAMRCSARQLRRHQHLLRRSTLHDGTLSRTPFGYYQIQKGAVIPQGVLDNPELPSLLRKAARAAMWWLRDLAVLELLLCSGARVAEVCGMTWAGMDTAGLNARVRLHTKGQGYSPRKLVDLSNEATRALLAYFLTERPKYDEHHSGCVKWLRTRAWTPERYLEYLRREKIDPASVPVFLTERKTPYSPTAFWAAAWAKLRRRSARHMSCGQLIISPHHIRHWYINADLDRIWAEHGDEEFGCVKAVEAYVTDMGWLSWRSLQHYDHRGAVTFLMQAWMRTIASKAAPPPPIMNGLLDELQADGILPLPVGTA
ncbi:tyrosine-type recombinase/integrase (plasmid) [Deinococcus taeanensis]|uniref:tyrosine-type recombinase/integrase n=1 Tax=Deinococcus taeanensis TaxID=2737050 RepID=UPI001CDD0D57|nr:tyrosine-type recombinase/integrase [Deinococcus taeanensis]UBV45555.1 tyrosine-type recombinase/integrase [Deinococcus taeanensis]